ncbi:hypothetical protein ACFV3E_24450 [Streptomyces sp. NPDC059718]
MEVDEVMRVMHEGGKIRVLFAERYVREMFFFVLNTHPGRQVHLEQPQVGRRCRRLCLLARQQWLAAGSAPVYLKGRMRRKK